VALEDIAEELHILCWFTHLSEYYTLLHK